MAPHRRIGLIFGSNTQSLIISKTDQAAHEARVPSVRPSIAQPRDEIANCAVSYPDMRLSDIIGAWDSD
jgi:hypothetical protein